MRDVIVTFWDGRPSVEGPMWTWRPKEGWFELVGVDGQIKLNDTKTVEVEERTGPGKVEKVDLRMRALKEGWKPAIVDRNPSIPMDQCRERQLYRIISRNLDFGVFRASTRGFIGIREKFGDLYLFEEYHWDTGMPYGTVKPQEELPESIPAEMILDVDNGDLFKWLEAMEKKYRKPE